MSGRPTRSGPGTPADPDEAATRGSGLVSASFAGTGALVVAAVAGATDPDTFGVFTAVASGALFTVGVVAFLWGYAGGVVRSRDEAVTLGGLFFLSGTAPGVVRFRMRLSLLVEVVAASVAAGLQPYTSVAFAVLAPMYGLGLMSAWGARHGSFPDRQERA